MYLYGIEHWTSTNRRYATTPKKMKNIIRAFYQLAANLSWLWKLPPLLILYKTRAVPHKDDDTMKTVASLTRAQLQLAHI